MKPHVDRLTRQAAERAIVLHDEEASAEQIEDALRWINESDENEAALMRIQAFWDACGGGWSPMRRSWLPWWQRGRGSIAHVAGYAAAAALALFGVSQIYGTFRVPADTRPDLTSRYASAVGEIRNVRLPDNSLVTLAGATTISVRYRQKERRIVLVSGEALFRVAHASQRPFIVESGAGTTTATGTAFDVHRDSRGATVTVLHGAVKVRAPGEGLGSAVHLTPAMQVSYAGTGFIGGAHSVDPRAVMAWQTGRFNFSNQPLGAVIADLNRYSLRPVTIEDRELATIPVTGTVEIGGIEEWLRGLASVTDISVIDTGSELLLRKRAAGSRANI